MASDTSRLPQLGSRLFLTDGGIETTLIFHQGFELPEFAAFDLLRYPRGRAALRRYYRDYALIARDHGCGFVLETPTWRASPGWGARIGYSEEAIADVNRKAVALVEAVRSELESPDTPMVISGCVGPEGDAYDPASPLKADEARRYHSAQIEALAETTVDLITAMTMTSTAEAVGVVRAARAVGLPVVVSFTTETDGRLPSGESLGLAVRTVDDATDGAPAYYMINCAHTTHFEDRLYDGGPWTERVRGLRANASRLSHAELDDARELDDGDPVEFGARHADLLEAFDHITVVGGCCGTDRRHVEAVARAATRRAQLTF